MQQILKESGISYASFVDDITEMVKCKLGREYDINVIKVTKNNSIELDSLVIRKKGRNFAPNIYLLPYYEAYMDGVSLQELTNRLCMSTNNYSDPFPERNLNLSLDEMKDNIVIRLVNYDKNKKLLESIPHIKYLDLAVIFHCLVHSIGEGIGTIRVTNEHLKLWNMTLDEMESLALKNTTNRFPANIRSMEDVIGELLNEELAEPSLPSDLQEEIDQLKQETKQLSEINSNTNMYILSNNKGINGAACLLYKNVLKQFAEQLQSDFFILPSSIHEVILIPYHSSISYQQLTKMVQEVNLTQVAGDEVLSDKVYYYSRSKDAISI
ncbi:MAG: DUF5688 family protein [Mobilitalea sp.]